MKFSLLELATLPVLFLALSAAMSLADLSPQYSLGQRAKRDIAELDLLAQLTTELETVQEYKALRAESNSSLSPEVWTDTWGNAYVCIPPDSPDSNGLLFYSKGHDRISRTNGSDADDLNSWDRSWDYYTGFDANEGHVNRYATAALLTLPAFIIMLYFKRWLFDTD